MYYPIYCAAVLSLLLAGCASTEVVTDGTVLPVDFSLDLTVLSSMEDEGHQPVELRSSRYVIFPDGTFQAQFGEELTTNDASVYARTLNSEQMGAVWHLLVELGFASKENADSLGNIELIHREPGQMTYVIVVTANDSRMTFGRTRNIDDEPDRDIRLLTRAVAQLAFASDTPDRDLLKIPMRYDFGPDPYAPYREPVEVDSEGSGN